LGLWLVHKGMLLCCGRRTNSGGTSSCNCQDHGNTEMNPKPKGSILHYNYNKGSNTRPQTPFVENTLVLATLSFGVSMYTLITQSHHLPFQISIYSLTSIYNTDRIRCVDFLPLYVAFGSINKWIFHHVHLFLFHYFLFSGHWRYTSGFDACPRLVC
jgi:hypothetical protein